jgi:hypothetical protein
MSSDGVLRQAFLGAMGWPRLIANHPDGDWVSFKRRDARLAQ